jgi:capsular polysaccharide biosynthesis protein
MGTDSGERLGEFMELPSDSERTITSLKDLLLPVWKRLWVVVLVVMVVVGTTIGFTLVQTPMYEASVNILIGSQKKTEVPANLFSDVDGLQMLTQVLTEAVASRPVAEAAIQRLDLSMSPNALLDNLTASQVNATPFISISYRDPDPERAHRIAGTVAEVFTEKVSEVNPSASPITAKVWERPPAPEEPVSPNLLLNVLAALAIGLMLGVGLAFLLEHLDDSWRSPEELERLTGVPTFAVVPVFKASKGEKESK